MVSVPNEEQLRLIDENIERWRKAGLPEEHIGRSK